MRVLDLFSGIGGFSLGLERAGMETVAFCEQDKYCQKVLKKHWPDVPIFDDVVKFRDWSEVLGEKPDVICGGFPCQDISVAGQKKGLKGERSGLWAEFKRIIKKIEPRYAIIENVANLRNMGLAQIIQDLWKIGYACEWHIISARSVGACHLRERIWIIAYPTSEGSQIDGCSQGRKILPREEETQQEYRRAEPGGSPTVTDTERKRSGWVQSGGCSRQSGAEKVRAGRVSENRSSTDTDLPRLWWPFASEKEKSEWWAEATSGFSDVFREINEVEPTICRGDDGLSKRLDERNRKERVKQLGNAVVPQIVELIGKQLMEIQRDETRNLHITNRADCFG